MIRASTSATRWSHALRSSASRLRRSSGSVLDGRRLNHHGPQTYPPNNRGLPFGPHPHRGFETVTFILEGELSHLDSGGHESIIRAGGVQWMTAGSGLVHSEMPGPDVARNGGRLHGFQLWVNLPRSAKMAAPKYQELASDRIPTAEAGGALALDGVAHRQCGRRNRPGVIRLALHGDASAHLERRAVRGDGRRHRRLGGGQNGGGRRLLTERRLDGHGVTVDGGDEPNSEAAYPRTPGSLGRRTRRHHVRLLRGRTRSRRHHRRHSDQVATELQQGNPP